MDCGMILCRVYCDLNLVPSFDPRPYPDDWHLHRSEERYLRLVLAHCREVAAPAPGDVALFRWGRCHAHGGVVTVAEPLTIVHAFSPAGRVVEEEVRRNALLADPARAPRFFRLREGV